MPPRLAQNRPRGLFSPSPSRRIILRDNTYDLFPMKFSRLLSVSVLGFAGLFAPAAHALVAPQDNWRSYSNYSWSFTGHPRAVVAGSNDDLYVAVQDSSGAAGIDVYSRTGTLLRRFVDLPALGRVASLTFGTNGTLYVLSSDQLVRAYAPDGTLSTQWGGAGTGNGLFGTIGVGSQIATDTTGNVYVADQGNRIVQKFSPSGAFLLQWGGPGTLAGQFGTSGAMLLNITPQNKILVASNVSGRLLQLFNPDGSILSSPSNSGSLIATSSVPLLAVFPDGLVALSRSLSIVSVYDESLTPRGGLSVPTAQRTGITINSRGDYYISTYAPDGSGGTTGTITRFERGYSVDNPPAANALPQPVLISTEQRPSTPYVDIDYKVVDADDTAVRVALLGFVDGGNDLGKILKLSTFVEGTASRIGPDQPTNEVRRVTWNAAADWSVEFGNVQIEILAQDSRGLLPVHWITLPAQGADPALQISQRPVTDAEWLHLWYWLIAINESDIALADGQITGVGGAFDGQVLATTTDTLSTTTEAGRAYLRAKCGVRSLTADEIARATAGQFGFASVDEFSVARLPDPAP
jgi:hypothetical protein